jgi:hypothetical protein
MCLWNWFAGRVWKYRLEKTWDALSEMPSALIEDSGEGPKAQNTDRNAQNKGQTKMFQMEVKTTGH